MAKKKELVVNKMYEWEIDVDGEIRIWKCFVGVDECITYEGNRECERFKIDNLVQKQGVLQIDREVKVYDDNAPFQLENGVPYIKLIDDEGNLKWIKSDTTMADHLRIKSNRVKQEAYVTIGLGIVMLVMTLVLAILHKLGEWSILPALGLFLIATGGMNMIRLRRELEAMGETFSWKLMK